MQELTFFIGAIVLGISEFLILDCLKKTNISIIKRIFSLVMIVSLLFLSGLKLEPLYRSIFLISVFFIISFVIYNESVTKSIINAFYIQLLCMVGEIIFTILIFLVFQNNDVTVFISSNSGQLLCNFSVSLLIYVLSKIKLINTVYNKLINYTGNLSVYKTGFYISFSFIMMIVLFYIVYYIYCDNHFGLYLISVLVFIFYTIIMLMILFYNNRYNKIRSKYSISLDNLKEYEDVINRYRIMSHENKNQLLVIRNMGNYKDAKNYIDNIIGNEEIEKKDISYKVKRIPSPYLRTVIYTKMVKMENNNINGELIINRNVTSKSFMNISDATMLDICNIMNVFLDNAIDEVLKHNERSVSIDLCKEDSEILISVSNVFVGNISLSQINNIGYSTKGVGHGYGLSLVRETVDKNRDLKYESEIYTNIIIQTLKIKSVDD